LGRPIFRGYVSFREGTCLEFLKIQILFLPQETVGAMVVSEIIVQLAEFARGRLTLRGKSKVVQEQMSRFNIFHRGGIWNINLESNLNQKG